MICYLTITALPRASTIRVNLQLTPPENPSALLLPTTPGLGALSVYQHGAGQPGI